ncbi:DNA polymerase-3 subunit gamma/tau [Lachnospiraceae bacterium]|nr:DNA polymerase-3 subunit gamma/tau [Lachnospiraceae bacterium]
MSYVALYRKFRPDSFSEVKGQDHIVTTLKNQLKADRVGHAYLFCGTRGTGKTTVAKLLAKTVNCENPTEDGPCGVCPSCKAIADGSSLNVREIDAASNNGVDNIRQINDSVQYSPAQGKYLVYIIDEVHMLSAGAYNALLKTLEEPPEYVIFILATTDDHKLPVTIKSRCQRYDFHRISLDTIADRLEDIVSREGGRATRDALRFIARTADGSMRDALSILDECMSASLEEELTRDGVLKTIGAVSIDIYVDMLRAVKEDNAARVLEIINESIYNGKDLTKFVDDFAWFMRNVLFLRLSPALSGELDITSETAAELSDLGADFSTETLTRYLNILQELCSDIRYSSIKRVTLEMAMIRMMRPETDVDLSAVIGRLERLENQNGPMGNEGSNSLKKHDSAILNDNDDSRAGYVSGGITPESLESEISRIVDEKIKNLGPVSEKKAPFDREKQSEIIKNNIREQYPEADANDILSLAKRWREIIGKLEGPQKSYAAEVDVEPASGYTADGPARLRIVFDEKDTDNVRYIYFQRDKNRSDFADKLSEIIGKRVEIDVITKKGTKDVLDNNSIALNKINFDGIKVIERED